MKRTEKLGWAQIALIRPLLVISLLSLVTVGFKPGPFTKSGISPQPDFSRTSTLASTLDSASPQTLRVLSYNILFGAGVDRRYDDLLAPGYANQDRLPRLISFIQETKPDLLGLQEANGWNQGSPSVAVQVAEQLKMSYFLAEAPNDFHVVLLTKLRISDVENLSGKEGDPYFETMRALRATLVAPDGQLLNVFIVHLEPFSKAIRLCQLETLITEFEPYQEQATMLLGDMNFEIGSQEYVRLEQSGWRLIAVATNIDQIWIPGSADWSSRSLFTTGDLPLGISNHRPVGAEISVYPTITGALASYPHLAQYLSSPSC